MWLQLRKGKCNHRCLHPTLNLLERCSFPHLKGRLLAQDSEQIELESGVSCLSAGSNGKYSKLSNGAMD
jgi:hypothetical protein